MSKMEKITKANTRKKQIIISSALMAVIIASSLGIVSATQADERISNIWSILTDDQKQQVEQMRTQKEQQRANMLAAIENSDYDKWLEIINSQPKITDYINKDNFAKFSEMHKLMKDEKFTEAAAIRAELGLPDGLGGGMGMGMGLGIEGKGMGRHGMQEGI